MAAFLYASASAGEIHQDCSMVCLELCKSYSEHYPNIQVCNNHCCPTDPFLTEVSEALPTSQEQNDAVTPLPKDVHGGPNRDLNCNLDMFNQCQATYKLDYNYYNRWSCVVASGCVSWTTFSLHNK
jgi:hypothetical protein